MAIAQYRGRPLRIRLNSTKKVESTISASDTQMLQTNFNLSKNKTISIAKIFRAIIYNIKAIEQNLKQKTFKWYSHLGRIVFRKINIISSKSRATQFLKLKNLLSIIKDKR